jgi:hypothetical protein
MPKRATHRWIFIAVILSALASGCGEKRKAEAEDPANAPRVATVKVQRKSLASTLEISSEFLP